MSDDLQQIVRAKDVEKVQAVAEIKQVAKQEVATEKNKSLVSSVIIGLGAFGFFKNTDPQQTAQIVQNLISTALVVGALIWDSVKAFRARFKK